MAIMVSHQDKPYTVCPAATGLMCYGKHKGAPHRCTQPADLVHYDHTCACGGLWTTAPPLKQRLRDLGTSTTTWQGID